MTKVEESVMTVDDLKAQLADLIGLNIYMEKDIIDCMVTSYIQKATECNETRAEEALTLAEKAMSMLEDVQFRGILVAVLLSKLPMGAQNEIVTSQRKVLSMAMVEYMKEKVGDNPALYLAMLGTVFEEYKNQK